MLHLTHAAALPDARASLTRAPVSLPGSATAAVSVSPGSQWIAASKRCKDHQAGRGHTTLGQRRVVRSVRKDRSIAAWKNPCQLEADRVGTGTAPLGHRSEKHAHSNPYKPRHVA